MWNREVGLARLAVTASTAKAPFRPQFGMVSYPSPVASYQTEEGRALNRPVEQVEQ